MSGFKDLIKYAWRIGRHAYSRYTVSVIYSEYKDGVLKSQSCVGVIDGKRDDVKVEVFKRWQGWCQSIGVDIKDTEFLTFVKKEMMDVKDVIVLISDLNDVNGSIGVALNLTVVQEFYITKR